MLSLCLVEDNKKLGMLIQESLAEIWYTCDWYQSVEELPQDSISRYHIFLLDVNLPGVSWFDFAKTLKKTESVGIIFLTANWTIDDKQEGFDAWADDYITKPFAVKELILRIKSLSKRLSKTWFFIYNEFIIDCKNHKAKHATTPIHLTPTEWLVLEYLIRRAGSVCQRTDIIDEVWWYEAVYTMSRSLDVTIAHLRNKLDKQLIETIAWVGYTIDHENLYHT